MKRATMAEAYPLHWPDGFTRREPSRRRRAAFRIASLAVARDFLLDELRRLGARYVVLSSNVPVRHDGLPYANVAEPRDPGVCVYFDLEGEARCIPCDAWDRVKDNILAVAKTVEAMRGIERWGSGEMMRRAFSAFQALPSPAAGWRTVLGMGPGPATRQAIDEAYRERARALHPDMGGTHEGMVALNAARDAAYAEVL